MIVEPRLYRRALERKQVYVQPFDDFISRELVRGKRRFLLSEPPAESLLYRDDTYLVVELPLRRLTEETR